MSKAERLAEHLLAGERLALAKAITLVEGDSGEAATLLRAIEPRLGGARVVGFTGPPGVGKSTLINAYVSELRRRGRSVAVAAVDPSSPFSGGAILGDRIRMVDHAVDPEVFVRSLASRGHLGGLSATAARVVDVMDAAGKDVVVVETVGAGQAEVEVAEVADTKVVVFAPGLGDDIQAIKAGILEIADILVVNKGDLPLAERAVQHLKGMLSLRARGAPPVPVLTTEAIDGRGISELADAIERHGESVGAAARRRNPSARLRRLIAAAAGRLMQDHLARGDVPHLDRLCQAVHLGELSLAEAARHALAGAAATLAGNAQADEDRE
jgi:LAO/AO transport system kinase